MLYKKSSRSSLLDSDIYGLLRFVGPMVCRTNGVSDQWCVGPLVCRTNGVSDQWCVGPMVCRTNGVSDQWSVTVGCILIIARSLFMALQWRRRCISSSISFDSHLVHIRWFIGVIGLLYRPLSIFKSCELILYLAIAFMRWFPFMLEVPHTKIFSLMNMCVAYLNSRYLLSTAV